MLNFAGMKKKTPTIFTQEIYDDIMDKLYSMNHDMKIIWRVQVVLWGIVISLLISKYIGL